jgi:hypothetical protein
MRPGQPFAPHAKPTAAAVRRMTGETLARLRAAHANEDQPMPQNTSKYMILDRETFPYPTMADCDASSRIKRGAFIKQHFGDWYEFYAENSRRLKYQDWLAWLGISAATWHSHKRRVIAERTAVEDTPEPAPQPEPLTFAPPPEPQPLTPSDHPHALLERLSRLVDEVRAAGITVEIAVTYSYSATL